jgi:lysyl-tRNA synthetase class 2
MIRDHEDPLIEARLLNLRKIEALGHPAWPSRFDADITVSAAVALHGPKDAATLEAESPRHRIAGRITANRKQGKAAFLDLHDGTERLQVYLKKDRIGEPAWELYGAFDLGDSIGVEGRVFRTRTGELTVEAARIEFLGKALRPLPEKWHGLKDLETRYRQRYLDLVANPETHRVFRTRAAIVRGIRRFFDDRDFVEVETPMMQAVPGGAVARPFVTHHNALDIDLFLRIAPELFLKRLVVGGMPRVYELNRNFRNEGISTRHNPEFTMLEFYMAYADFGVLMDLTEELIRGIARQVLGSATLSWGEETIDLAAPWRRIGMREAVLEEGGRLPEPIREDELADAASLLAVARRVGCEAPERYEGQAGKLLAELFETVVEPHLLQPTFITGFPVEVSPLSKRNAANPSLVDRFELFVGRMEIANGFSELNDPADQEARFRAQLEAKAKGDDEAHPMDEDYITALEHGLPPTAGEGIGIDRLAMLFTNSASIRDVILFPLMRPR